MAPISGLELIFVCIKYFQNPKDRENEAKRNKPNFRLSKHPSIY